MLLNLLKIPWYAFRDGKVCGQPITRNPILWIPYFIWLPVVFVFWLVFVVCYILALPFVIVVYHFWWKSFTRKSAVYSDAGIHFPRAYGRITIAWSDIQEVVQEREPKAMFYRVVMTYTAEQPREYIISSMPDDEAFERTLNERRIPFRYHDWLDRTEPVA